MKKMSKQALEGLKSIGDELGEQLKGEVKKTVGIDKKADKNGDDNKSIDLFSDLREMSKGEMNEKQMEDEVKKRQEMAKIRGEIGGGRNLEREMEELRRKRKKEEEEREKREEELEVKKKQKVAEQQARMTEEGGMTSQHKKKKRRGGAFVKGKKPSMDEMTATGEFGKKGE